MPLLEIAVGATIGAIALPFAGMAIGITAVGPVAGGAYAFLQSCGIVLPAVQSTLMTVGTASIAKTALLGAATAVLI